MPSTQTLNSQPWTPTDYDDCCNDGADSGEREQSGREDAAEAAERGGCCGSPRSLVFHVDHDRAEDERSVEGRSVEGRSKASRGQSCRVMMRRKSYNRQLHLCLESFYETQSMTLVSIDSSDP